MKNSKIFSMLSLVILTALSGCTSKTSSSGSNSEGSNTSTSKSETNPSANTDSTPGSNTNSNSDPNTDPNTGSNTDPVTEPSSEEPEDPKRTTKIHFWTGFGNNVNSVLQPLLKRFEAQNPTVKVEYNPQSGGYNALRQAILSSVSTNSFPHIANGYPDHFALYANSNIVLNLNTNALVKNPDPNIGVDLTHYLPDYMEENMALAPPGITGLPFNKSTEVMVTNQSFFNVAMALDSTIKVPETWQELKVQGKKIKDLADKKGWFGKLVKHDGTTVDKLNQPTKEQINALIPEIAFDMTQVKKEEFIPFSWDSGSNFFITILRQWDAQYTKQGANFQSGKVVFHDATNKPKAIEALQYIQDLYKDKIVGLPISYGETLYSSKPFKEGKLVMTVSSSAGISSNMPAGTTDFPFEVAVNKIPYNELFPDHKFVISQGTNLGLFNRGKMTDPKVKLEREAAWRLLRFLTYEVNHEFGMGTSYFPVTDGTKLAVDENDQRYKDYKKYKDFLAINHEDRNLKAIQDTAKVQATGYQAKDGSGNQIWKQFVDPGFLGSSRIRDEVENVLPQLFAENLTPSLVIQGVIDKIPSESK